MSTRSVIAVKEKDGTITAIYCHYDGYVEGVGKTLYQHYKDPEAAHELIGLGNISSLGEMLNPTEPWHTFDHPQKGVTVAYCRDRGEDFQQMEFDDVAAFSKELKKYLYTIDYVYVYDMADEKWYVNGEPITNYFDVSKNELLISCSDGWMYFKTAKTTLADAIAELKDVVNIDNLMVLKYELRDSEGNPLETYGGFGGGNDGIL